MSRRFVPATGIDCLLPWYDPAVRCLTRQRALHSDIVDTAKLLTPSTVLDVGCGSGTLAIALKQNLPSANVVACDVDQRMLAQAKAKPNSQQVIWICAPATDLPQPAGSVDVVVSSLLMHHLTDNEKLEALRSIRVALRPGGTLLLVDYGRPASILSRLLFLPVRLLDGWVQTASNVAGRLPELIALAGFERVHEVQRYHTPLGTVRQYQATAGIEHSGASD